MGGKREQADERVGASGRLGTGLRERRLRRNIAQAQLAARLRMSPANLSRIEHGADFRVSTLLELARELKLEPVLVPKEHVPAVRALIGADADEEPERGRFA
jgi:HTH-type transcriptional regulator / antitoxin HipB